MYPDRKIIIAGVRPIHAECMREDAKTILGDKLCPIPRKIEIADVPGVFITHYMMLCYVDADVIKNSILIVDEWHMALKKNAWTLQMPVRTSLKNNFLQFPRHLSGNNT